MDNDRDGNKNSGTLAKHIWKKSNVCCKSLRECIKMLELLWERGKSLFPSVPIIQFPWEGESTAEAASWPVPACW